MKHLLFFRFMFIAGLVLLPCSGTDAAQQKPADKLFKMSIEELMEMEVVTATRTKVKYKKTPSAIYVITARQIRERGYRTLADALHDVPGFDFQHTYGIFPDLIHQRGFVGNNQRSLVYVDGILDNNISENAVLGGTIRFPLYHVERIEIVAGPVSALYGANAFNGVINIITKQGSADPERTVQAFAGSWMDSEHTGGGMVVSASGQTTMGSDDASYSVSAYFQKTDGPDFRGVQHLDQNGQGYWWSDHYNVSNEETYNVTAKLRVGNLRFETVNWQYLHGDGTFANGTRQIDTDHNGFDGSAWDFRSNTASLGYLKELTPQLSLDSEIVVRQTELLSSSHESYPNNPGPDAYDRPDDVTHKDNYARPDYAYEIEERLMWRPTDRFEGTLGTEAIYTVVPNRYGSSDRIKYKNYAGYGQGIYQVNELLSLMGGYRFDANTIYENANTYRISAVCSPGDVTVKAMFATAFRAPTAWEMFNDTLQRKQNPDLKPEKMRSIELGVGYQFSDIGHISLHGYYNKIRDVLLEVKTDDPILSTDAPDDFWNQNRNVGDARVLGIEFDSDVNLTDWMTVFFNYTFSEGKYHDLSADITDTPTAHNGESIPNIPKHKFNTGVTWYLTPDLLVHLRANYVYDRKTIATNPVTKVDDYVVFHSNIRWENLFMEGLFVQVFAGNLLDNDDAFDPGIRTATGRYYPTQHPLEGRNIWLTVGYGF